MCKKRCGSSRPWFGGSLSARAKASHPLVAATNGLMPMVLITQVRL
jgi:hypothetical protein